MKRGEVHWDLVALVLVIASVMIGIVLIISINGVWRSKSVTVDCSAEVRAHAAIQKYSKEQVSPSSIRCPTNQITVSGEIQAKGVIANEMLRCFDQWGRGELSLFGDQTGTYCHVCGVITVNGASEIRDMTEYLDTHKAGKGDLTYLQALIGTTRGDLYTPKNAPAVGEDVLSTAQPLGVIFRYEKGAQAGQQIKNYFAGEPLRGFLAGGTGGAIAVAAGLTTGVLSGGTIVVGGAILGATGAFIANDPLDTVASVNVRPLDAGSISALGCDYLPVQSN